MRFCDKLKKKTNGDRDCLLFLLGAAISLPVLHKIGCYLYGRYAHDTSRYILGNVFKCHSFKNIHIFSPMKMKSHTTQQVLCKHVNEQFLTFPQKLGNLPWWKLMLVKNKKIVHGMFIE